MKNRSGFTLIEILVVVAVLGLISVFAIPKVSNILKISLNSTTRELASIVKEAYNATVVTGRVHRVAYDLEKSKYWVEAGPAMIMLETQESREKEDERKRLLRTEKKAPSLFAIAASVTKKPISLPKGVKFKDVTTEQNIKEPTTTGIAYTHFFPHGVAEVSVIHLNDQEGHEMTLVISPLIGTTKLLPGYVATEEAIKR